MPSSSSSLTRHNSLLTQVVSVVSILCTQAMCLLTNRIFVFSSQKHLQAAFVTRLTQQGALLLPNSLRMRTLSIAHLHYSKPATHYATHTFSRPSLESHLDVYSRLASHFGHFLYTTCVCLSVQYGGASMFEQAGDVQAIMQQHSSSKLYVNNSYTVYSRKIG